MLGSSLFRVGGLAVAGGGGGLPVTTNLFLHHRADALVLSNNDPVADWDNDEGTAARDLSQATSGLRPVFKSAPTGFNGLPAVYFNGHTAQGGNNQHLLWANLFTGLTAAEIFIVMKLDADPPPSNLNVALWSFGSATGDSIPYTTSQIFDAFATTVRKTTVNPSDSMASTCLYNVTSKSGGWTSRLNGTQIFTTATNTVGWHTDVRLGYSHASTYFKGHIAEVVLYSAEVSGGDRDLIEDYVETKYGFTVA